MHSTEEKDDVLASLVQEQASSFPIWFLSYIYNFWVSPLICLESLKTENK